MSTQALPEGVSALAAFVLKTVETLRAMTGEQAAGPDLGDVRIREITFSIPYDPGAGAARLGAFDLPSLTLQTGLPILRLPQAEEYLKMLDPHIVFERARLIQLPAERIARLEITIRL